MALKNAKPKFEHVTCQAKHKIPSEQHIRTLKQHKTVGYWGQEPLIQNKLLNNIVLLAKHLEHICKRKTSRILNPVAAQVAPPPSSSVS